MTALTQRGANPDPHRGNCRPVPSRPAARSGAGSSRCWCRAAPMRLFGSHHWCRVAWHRSAALTLPPLEVAALAGELRVQPSLAALRGGRVRVVSESTGSILLVEIKALATAAPRVVRTQRRGTAAGAVLLPGATPASPSSAAGHPLPAAAQPVPCAGAGAQPVFAGGSQERRFLSLLPDPAGAGA